MKKIIWLTGIFLMLWGTAVPVMATETTSNVGITFYQNTSRGKIVPMQKIAVPTDPTKQEPTIHKVMKQKPTVESLFERLPKTNQQTAFFLLALGSFLLSMFCALYCKKKARKSYHEITA